MDKIVKSGENQTIRENEIGPKSSLLEKSGGIGYNRRDMPKRTYQPHTRHRARTHGFRARIASKAGRAVIKRRRIKGRAKLTA